MAEFKDLAEKLNTLHVSEHDVSMSDNKLSSDPAEILKENVNDSDKGCENADTLDIQGFCGTADSKNEDETDELKSSAIHNNLQFNGGQVLEEISNAKTEENPTETESVIRVQNNRKSGTESVGSIIADFQNKLDFGYSAIERKRNLLLVTLRAKKYSLLTLNELKDHYLKLLQKKLELLQMKKEILQSYHNVLIGIQPKDITSDLEQILKETHLEFSEHREAYAKCKSVLEAYMQITEKIVDVKNLPSTDQNNAHFSTLEDISFIKFLLESSVKASEEFENSIKNCLKISTEDPERRIDFLLHGIDKASAVCTELSLFGNTLSKHLDSIETCVRNMED